MDNVPGPDIYHVMGDVNAKVGTNNDGFQNFMDDQGMGERNGHAQHFLDRRKGNNSIASEEPSYNTETVTQRYTQLLTQRYPHIDIH